MHSIKMEWETAKYDESSSSATDKSSPDGEGKRPRRRSKDSPREMPVLPKSRKN